MGLVQQPPQGAGLVHQAPQGVGLVQHLKQEKLQEQVSLQQQGVTDPLEAEFSTVVGPIMETCTKDSIAVSGMHVCVCVHGIAYILRILYQ